MRGGRSIQCPIWPLVIVSRINLLGPANVRSIREDFGWVVCESGAPLVHRILASWTPLAENGFYIFFGFHFKKT